MINKNILILEGGNNEEHEISLSTANEVKKALLDLNHQVKSLRVDPTTFEQKISEYEVDICFNALHGPFGEDGKVQEILFNKKIHFTHSGVKASTIAFDKYLTKEKIKKKGIIFPDSILINKKELDSVFLENFLNKIGIFILKPRSSGSSFGVQIIKSKEDINSFLIKNVRNKDTYKEHENLMIEPYIEGKELTVAVVEENNFSKAIEVTEIISNNIFFDYESKYTEGFSKHILPASVPKKIYQQCLKNAKAVHDILGCKGISRSDFIYNEKNDKIYFLEINTQPGLTPISLVPEQLNYNNINFTMLIDKLLKAATCQK